MIIQPPNTPPIVKQIFLETPISRRSCKIYAYILYPGRGRVKPAEAGAVTYVIESGWTKRAGDPESAARG